MHLLSDLNAVDELRGIAVEVHHVAGFARGLCAGVHGHADVGLGGVVAPFIGIKLVDLVLQAIGLT